MTRKTVSLILTAILMLALFAGCQSTSSTPPANDPNPNADTNTPADTENPSANENLPAETNPYETTGSISIGYPEGERDEIVPVLDAFRAMYPNITLVDVPFAGSEGGSFNKFLTERAASNDMPDVMWLDWNDFAPQVASGYVMPLNEFFEKDPEAAYVPSGMTDPYTFNGKLYAFPCQMNAMGITINLDMLEDLNLDKPSYDWTWDEFVEFVKAGISADTAGAALLEDLDVTYSAQADGFFATAYDYKNQKFDFTNQWVPAMNRYAELNAIPGLNAWAMKFPKDENGQTPLDSDYVAKFGEEGKDDNHYLFKNGLALLCTNATWNDNWMRNECKINWDYWPYPRMGDDPVKTPIHVDCSYVTSTSKDKEAAFELLKWLTYGLEGNLQRLDIFAARGDKQQVEGDTKLLKTWFIPCTQHPDVIAKFEENPHLTEGFKALYKSTSNSIRGDLNKFLPNFGEFWDANGVWGKLDDVRQGRAAAADVAAELDTLLNAGLAEQMEAFNSKLAALN
jgi:ABC-type glycerol-3-phosphate transport system substrate-binding protein